jgi:phosphate acetyltransferase
MASEKLHDRRDHAKYERLIERASQTSLARTVVVHPCDETSLCGAVAAANAKLTLPTLVGPAPKILALAEKHGPDISPYQLLDVPHSDAAAAKGVPVVRSSDFYVRLRGRKRTVRC